MDGSRQDLSRAQGGMRGEAGAIPDHYLFEYKLQTAHRGTCEFAGETRGGQWFDTILSEGI